jgi:hypothetical protein
VAEEEHAGVKPMEPTGAEPPSDRRGGDAQTEELATAHDAVLAAGERRYSDVAGGGIGLRSGFRSHMSETPHTPAAPPGWPDR